MLPDLLTPLAGEYQFFNLFRYITFRTGGATITALIISLMFGPAMIRWRKSHQAEGQPIRADGPESHLVTKIGTPTMGGLLILGAFALTTLLWMPLSNPYLWPVLTVALAFGAVGSVDDWMKLRRRSHHGMSGRMKLLLQIGVAFVVTLFLIEMSPPQLRYGVAVPFLKDTMISLGLLYVPFAMVVIVGASNAVNLTDGLDGLAIVPVMIVAACFGLIAYLAGNVLEPVSVSCGSTPRLPRCLWATPGRWPSGARSARCRWRRATSWCLPSPAACSSSRRCP